MTVKQTDRAQIENFASQGIAIFNQIEAQLMTLVEQTATVHYRGANALEFKTKCTSNAVEFANYCTTNMQQMSQVMTEATTFIATALGGAGITLEPPTAVVQMPAIDADTSVEAAEDGPLNDLRASATTIYGQIDSLFSDNLSNLQALGNSGWIGPEFDAAQGSMASLTAMVLDGSANSRSVMEADISNQLSALAMG